MPDQLALSHRETDQQKDESAGSVRKSHWGAELRSDALSIVHPELSLRKNILVRLGIISIALAWAPNDSSTPPKQLAGNPDVGFPFQFEAASYQVAVKFLTLSALVYAPAKQGGTVLLPSNQEEPDIIATLSKRLGDAGAGICLELKLLIKEYGVREFRQVLLRPTSALVKSATPENQHLAQLFARLTWIFGVKTKTFERKKYSGLSLGVNMDMNLNAYMSLMGTDFCQDGAAGANAVVRKPALEGIVEVASVGRFEVRTYTWDRTVIEDTDSSVDLGTHRWTLVNVPEPLSYGPKQQDFRAPVGQRNRWPNRSLLILPTLANLIRQRRIQLRGAFPRANYMASIARARSGLLFLLAMGSDIRDCGHRFSDIFRIYGLNLLLPINLAGVHKCLQLGITGDKIRFVRTPKVKGRTAAPALYVLISCIIVTFSLLTIRRDSVHGNRGNVASASLDAVLAGMPKPPEKVGWESILHHGDWRLNRDLRGRNDRRRQVAIR